MLYNETYLLKNGSVLQLRNAVAADADAVLQNFLRTHGETDFLLTYPEENTFTQAQEAAYLQAKEESADEIEIAAYVDGCIAGTAGIDSIGHRFKVKHRAEVGISLLKAYWGLGIGRALMEACIDCAQKAGYTQLELSVVEDNHRALALYKKLGFVEYGRNPKGFYSRSGGYQTIIHMRLEL